MKIVYDNFIVIKLMRTIIDLPKDLLNELDEFRKKENLSRAEVIRRAVRLYLQEAKRPPKDMQDKAFGIWRGRKINALNYENGIRKEWKQS